MENNQIGEIRKVRILEKEYTTIIDSNSVERFPQNKLLCDLIDNGFINIEETIKDFSNRINSQVLFIQFYIGLGYSVERIQHKFPKLTIERIL